MKRMITASKAANIATSALSSRVGDKVYDERKDRIGTVIKESQVGNYSVIWVDFEDGTKPVRIVPMDDAQRIGRYYKVLEG